MNALLLTLSPWWNSHPIGLTMGYFTSSRSMSSFKCWTFPLRPLWADWGETFSLERLILFHKEEQEQEACSPEFQSTLFTSSLKCPEHLFLYCTISWIAGYRTLFSDSMQVISSNLNPGSLFHILPCVAFFSLLPSLSGLGRILQGDGVWALMRFGFEDLMIKLHLTHPRANGKYYS